MTLELNAEGSWEKYALPDEKLWERFEFRSIGPEEGEQAAQIEQICFPPNEACTKERMLKRVENAAGQVLVAVDRQTGKLAGFFNGLATDEGTLRDEFFTDITLHDPAGENVMILGLDVLPSYRGQGIARELMYEYFRREKAHGRRKIILTCLSQKVAMYRKMGFEDRGISESAWGGEQWHEMVFNID